MYPPRLSFHETTEYRGIDKLKATLHLIINNFIKNQHKAVLNLDCVFRLNEPPIPAHVSRNMHLDGTANNFTTKQQINTHSMAQSLGRGRRHNKEIVQ